MSTLGLIQDPRHSPATRAARTEGSKFQLGQKFFGYAGMDASNVYHLIEPWDGVTGQASAVFYHSSYSFDASMIELLEAPEVLGWGPLSPMSDARPIFFTGPTTSMGSDHSRLRVSEGDLDGFWRPDL